MRCRGQPRTKASGMVYWKGARGSNIWQDQQFVLQIDLMNTIVRVNSDKGYCCPCLILQSTHWAVGLWKDEAVQSYWLQLWSLVREIDMLLGISCVASHNLNSSGGFVE